MSETMIGTVELAARSVNAKRSAAVYTRHSRDCRDKTRGRNFPRCDCPKWIQKYDGTIADRRKRQWREAAGTRSWEKAEQVANEWLDRFDPEAQELRRLRAEKKAHTVTIEEAVARFIASKKAEHLSEGTIEATEALLGRIDPENFLVRRNGQLFEWLEKQHPRPVFVSDFTPSLVESFRNGWQLGDLTAANRFTRLKTFFKYCESNGWIKESPMRNQRRPKVKKGNRTGSFTDEQWLAIESTAKANVDSSKGFERQTAQRLLTFVELLRWTGMALTDAVLFSPDLIKDGVLRYKRLKTGNEAIVSLRRHEDVLELVRTVPPGDGTAHQPFFNQAIELDSNKNAWWRQLQDLFDAAGVKSVKTDIGLKNPGAHTFRDTFAIGLIRGGTKAPFVAKALGDTVMITMKHYMPFFEEMEHMQVEEMDKANEVQLERLEEKREAKDKVVGIGGRRANS